MSKRLLGYFLQIIKKNLVKKRVFGVFHINEFIFLTVVVLMNTFKNKNSLSTIEAQIVQKLKNDEARPKFTGSYKTHS